MNRRTAAARVSALLLAASLAQAAAPGGAASIVTGDLREWLSYLASDELEGRATYTAGLGLAAGYIQSHRRDWGVKPAGDNGTYLQTVRVLGVKSTNRSTVTVTVNGRSRTFAEGEGIDFPANVGGRRELTIDRVEFVGYGADVPAANHRDYEGRNVAGAAVVWMGVNGPKTVDQATYRRVLAGRGRYATEQQQAAASIGQMLSAARRASPARPATPPRAASTVPDFTTAQRLDHPLPPNITAGEEFLSFLLSEAPTPYEQLKQRAADREPLPSFTLRNVRLTFNLDADYEVVRTRVTQNIVGIVEGSDPRLRDTYVAFGAHYDHVGYADAELNADGTRRPGAPGRITAGAAADRVWNGADDDGSGSVALMAIARAFGQGERPRRSLLFVWHAGEESGLLGSRYFVDHAPVPLESIVAQLNLDMVGRNRDDKASEANTVYVVGSDRISTQLHDINREANRALPDPLTLDYELNDPSDTEQIYYRSDHYSYAARGIPVIFFTTGLHPDYHANTDEVSKIEFGKLARVTALVYETGARVASRRDALERDNRGPRAGKGTR